MRFSKKKSAILKEMTKIPMLFFFKTIRYIVLRQNLYQLVKGEKRVNNFFDVISKTTLCVIGPPNWR